MNRHSLDAFPILHMVEAGSGYVRTWFREVPVYWASCGIVKLRLLT